MTSFRIDFPPSKEIVTGQHAMAEILVPRTFFSICAAKFCGDYFFSPPGCQGCFGEVHTESSSFLGFAGIGG
jgi:hypothetical protein